VATVQLTTEVSAAPELVEPLDVSEAGLRLIYGREIAPGSDCTLVIRARSGQWVRVSGKVVRCDPVPDTSNRWFVALQFDTHIAVNELLDVREGLNVVGKVA
jgi:hypothetical protein